MRSTQLDSSGFSASKFDRWFDHKYGEISEENNWVKAHIVCGVKTHIVTAVEIHEWSTNDSPLLPPLLHTTVANFTVKESAAGEQYASVDNIEAIHAVGATPFVAFRAGITDASGGLCRKRFRFFSLHCEEFLQSYHKRSNVESAFSTIKRKFGDSVHSKTRVTMRNEAL